MPPLGSKQAGIQSGDSGRPRRHSCIEQRGFVVNESGQVRTAYATGFPGKSEKCMCYSMTGVTGIQRNEVNHLWGLPLWPSSSPSAPSFTVYY